MTRKEVSRLEDGSVEPFGVVYRAAVDRLAGEPNALALYLVLAVHARRDSGECWPAQAVLADMLGVSISTVQRALAVCVSAEVVHVERRVMPNGKKIGNRYTLTDSGLGLSTPQSTPQSTPHGCGVEGATPHGRGVEHRMHEVSRARDLLPKKEQEEEQKQIPLAALEQVPVPLVDVPSAIDRIFDAWRTATGKTSRTLLTPKRRKLIDARLKEGYDVDDLVDAVRGWQQSPFHCGQNDRGSIFNDLELLLRDGANVERFRDMRRGERNVVRQESDHMRTVREVTEEVKRMRGGNA